MIYNPLVKIKDRASNPINNPQAQHPPFFCVPGTGGVCWCFHPLATHLSSKGYSVYGFDAPGILPSSEPLRTVEKHAKLYLTQMIRAFPSTSYNLGGYCFGGLVAWEMARMLRAGGYRVRLVLIDAATPRINVNNSLTTQQLDAVRSHRMPTNPDVSAEYWQVELAAIEAARNYYPQPLDVETLLITRYDNLLALDQWYYLTKGNLNEQAISCHHLEIFNEPHVKILAGWIDEFLTDSV